MFCFADTVYFHLPPISGADMKCVYGVSCYRQIEAKVGSPSWHLNSCVFCFTESSVVSLLCSLCGSVCRLFADAPLGVGLKTLVVFPFQSLKVRLADVTRETVQKSVCVLSRVVSRLTCDKVVREEGRKRSRSRGRSWSCFN